ncbi:winged helix-turn-helix domain-containing protein [Edaphovirga cremea]|uniref:winged helix-turn-helix domain-containing protein n=1 Tax=Edaphovirga cremea TaxID=2267246 RepID=UPI000DEFFE52|nr:winged helix-turn-helix domain-containing protein [Edaphovirga cremea]
MKYLIDEIIVFDTKNSMLSLKGYPEEIIPLQNTTRRLLMLLIINHGNPVTRAQLFQEVWDDHGLISNNNNLNQCVSKLRRNIQHLGIDRAAILTVPKVGFALAESISIAVIEESEETFPDSVEIAASEKSADNSVSTVEYTLSADKAAVEQLQHVGSSTKSFSTRYHFFWLLAVVSFALAFCVMWVYLNKNTEPVFFADIGGCHVHVTESYDEDIAKNIKKAFINFKSTHNIECGKNNYVIFYKKTLSEVNLAGVDRTFMGICNINKDKDLKDCKNYYLSVRK